MPTGDTMTSPTDAQPYHVGHLRYWANNTEENEDFVGCLNWAANEIERLAAAVDDEADIVRARYVQKALEAMEARTIERCAQVLMGFASNSIEVNEALNVCIERIRVLKDEPWKELSSQYDDTNKP